MEVSMKGLILKSVLTRALYSYRWSSYHSKYFYRQLHSSSVPAVSSLNDRVNIRYLPKRHSSDVKPDVTEIKEPVTDGELPHFKERKIGVTQREQDALLRKTPKRLANHRVLKVAVIGAPNAGKSTLVNQLIGWKFSTVSSMVHTTRHKSLGVLTEGNSQIIFLDTPGLITPMSQIKHKMESSLLKDPHSSLYDADLIIAVVDASKIWFRSQLDPELQKALHFHRNKKSVLVLNKVDIFPNLAKLLHSARVLSEGQFGQSKDWCRVIKRNANKKKVSLQELFDKADGKHNSVVNNCDKNNMTNDESEPIRCEVTNEDAPMKEDVTAADTPCLDDPVVWKHYYRDEMRRVEREIGESVGFSGFHRAFFMSALEGTQVDDLRSYLLEETQLGRWQFAEEVVTDQDPRELAKMCVWGRLLENLPDAAPYSIKLKDTVWAVDEDGLLHVEFEIYVKKGFLHNVISDIKKIAGEAKQELMNCFRREMTFRLVVKPETGKKRPVFKPWRNPQTNSTDESEHSTITV